MGAWCKCRFRRATCGINAGYGSGYPTWHIKAVNVSGRPVWAINGFDGSGRGDARRFVIWAVGRCRRSFVGPWSRDDASGRSQLRGRSWFPLLRFVLMGSGRARFPGCCMSSCGVVFPGSRLWFLGCWVCLYSCVFRPVFRFHGSGRVRISGHKKRALAGLLVWSGGVWLSEHFKRIYFFVCGRASVNV